MRIEIVSDFVCPYCWLGKKRLEAALARRPAIAAEIVWRPYELDPNVPEAGVPYLEFMRGIFGAGAAADARREQGWAGLTAAGAQVGAEYRFQAIQTRPNTLDAHRLSQWAQAEGRGGEVAEALFAANFRDGLDIGDRAVLADIAAQAGMDRASVLARLESGEDREAVRAQEEEFRRMGVSGVPTFIIDRRFGLTGAQDPEVLIQALDRALAA